MDGIGCMYYIIFNCLRNIRHVTYLTFNFMNNFFLTIISNFQLTDKNLMSTYILAKMLSPYYCKKTG